MPRKCSSCSHPKRADIDQALVNDESLRKIAEKFSLKITSVHRHKKSHLPAFLTKAVDAEEIIRADDLLAQVRNLQTKALSILAKAEAAGDLKIALQAIREARGNLELLARLLGELQEQSQTVNVLVANPNWLKLRSLILQSLEPYPEARLALVNALSKVEKADSSLAGDALT